jgi:hypothetical protein
MTHAYRNLDVKLLKFNSDSMIEMCILSLNASETHDHAELLSCLHLHRKEC